MYSSAFCNSITRRRSLMNQSLLLRWILFCICQLFFCLSEWKIDSCNFFRLSLNQRLINTFSCCLSLSPRTHTDSGSIFFVLVLIYLTLSLYWTTARSVHVRHVHILFNLCSFYFVFFFIESYIDLNILLCSIVMYSDEYLL